MIADKIKNARTSIINCTAIDCIGSDVLLH